MTHVWSGNTATANGQMRGFLGTRKKPTTFCGVSTDSFRLKPVLHYKAKNVTGLMQVVDFTGLMQVVLPTSSSCIKSVNIKLNCNLIFADLLQVDETICIKPACSSQLAASLLTTCNKLVIIKPEQAMSWVGSDLRGEMRLLWRLYHERHTNFVKWTKTRVLATNLYPHMWLRQSYTRDSFYWIVRTFATDNSDNKFSMKTPGRVQCTQSCRL